MAAVGDVVARDYLTAAGALRRDVTVYPPTGVPLAKTDPVAPGEIIAAQAQLIRELEVDLDRQRWFAATFSNVAAGLVKMLADADVGVAGEAVIPRTIVDRMEGSRVRLAEVGERGVRVTIEREGDPDG